MFYINFGDPKPIASVDAVRPGTNPIIVVLDVTCLNANYLNVSVMDFFSASTLDTVYYYVTIEDFDKIASHLVRINWNGDLDIVFATGSETGELVHYTARKDDEYHISPIQNVNVVSKVAIAEGAIVGVSTLPAVTLHEGQSINVGTMPAVSIAAGQNVGLVAGTKVGVSTVESMPQVEFAPNQGVNINNVPQVAIAENQEIGLKAGSTVAIDGAIQATIANDQAIGVYPVRRN